MNTCSHLLRTHESWWLFPKFFKANIKFGLGLESNIYFVEKTTEWWKSWVLIVQPKIPDLTNSPKSLGYCWKKASLCFSNPCLQSNISNLKKDYITGFVCYFSRWYIFRNLSLRNLGVCYYHMNIFLEIQAWTFCKFDNFLNLGRPLFI